MATSKIVLKTDGLIKLGKSGALAGLLLVAESLVPAVVYEEAVITGKRGMYEDTFELERMKRGSWRLRRTNGLRGFSTMRAVPGAEGYVMELLDTGRIQAGPDLGDYRCSREATRGLL